MGRVVIAAALALMASCVESPFREGRYLFDGRPSIHRRQIESITLEPIPEGPSAPVFVLHPQSEPFVRVELDLAEILSFVPDPLPPTLDQGDCEFGGDVVITAEAGTTIAYGPCRRPRSIEKLRARMIGIINESVDQ
jgi:hypothetical protein